MDTATALPDHTVTNTRTIENTNVPCTQACQDAGAQITVTVHFTVDEHTMCCGVPLTDCTITITSIYLGITGIIVAPASCGQTAAFVAQQHISLLICKWQSTNEYTCNGWKLTALSHHMHGAHKTSRPVNARQISHPTSHCTNSTCFWHSPAAWLLCLCNMPSCGCVLRMIRNLVAPSPRLS